MIRYIKSIFRKNSGFAPKKDLDGLKDNISTSFKNLKEDMNEQKRWIEYLHSMHTELNSLNTVLHDKHNHHQRVHAKDIDNINKWITHLHDTSKKQNELLRDLENNISLAFEKYNKYLIDLYRVVSEIKENKTTYINRAPSSSDVYRRPETRLDDQKMIEERMDEDYRHKKEEKEEHNKETKPPLEHYSDILTRSEKNILGELCNTSQKLSYKDIAVMTGVSSNTVKNHICHIKAKGFPIQEINDGNGIKRYYVSDNIRKVLLSKTI